MTCLTSLGRMENKLYKEHIVQCGAMRQLPSKSPPPILTSAPLYCPPFVTPYTLHSRTADPDSVFCNPYGGTSTDPYIYVRCPLLAPTLGSQAICSE